LKNVKFIDDIGLFQIQRELNENNERKRRKQKEKTF
jgi:hypothetical protein